MSRGPKNSWLDIRAETRAKHNNGFASAAQALSPQGRHEAEIIMPCLGLFRESNGLPERIPTTSQVG
jgi:hypothetical protein